MTNHYIVGKKCGKMYRPEDRVKMYGNNIGFVPFGAIILINVGSKYGISVGIKGLNVGQNLLLLAQV